MLDVRFAFASKIDYLCRRESDNVLSLFSCLAAKGLVRCVKMGFKIILKIQLVENKEVTLLVELNW